MFWHSMVQGGVLQLAGDNYRLGVISIVIVREMGVIEAIVNHLDWLRGGKSSGIVLINCT